MVRRGFLLSPARARRRQRVPWSEHVARKTFCRAGVGLERARGPFVRVGAWRLAAHSTVTNLNEENEMSNGSGGSDVVQQLQDGREWMLERLTQADRQARLFLIEHPVLSLACAVGIGYLAARLLRPRK